MCPNAPYAITPILMEDRLSADMLSARNASKLGLPIIALALCAETTLDLEKRTNIFYDA